MSESRLPPRETHRIKADLIRKSGRKCQACGYQFIGHPQQLAREDGAFELDHKIPLERCGTNELQNFQVLCLPCHDGKTNEQGKTGPIKNMTDDEWRAAWRETGRPLQDWDRKNQIIKRRNRRGNRSNR